MMLEMTRKKITLSSSPKTILYTLKLISSEILLFLLICEYLYLSLIIKIFNFLFKVIHIPNSPYRYNQQ